MRFAYDQPDPVAATGRTDREGRWSLGAAWRLSGTPQNPVSVGIGLLDIRHSSTVPFYDFDRRQGGARGGGGGRGRAPRQCGVWVRFGLLDIRHSSTVPFYDFDRRQWSLTL